MVYSFKPVKPPKKHEYLTSEERYRRFMKEYEALTKKYQMGFVIADILGIGFQCLEVWDEKEKGYICSED